MGETEWYRRRYCRRICTARGAQRRCVGEYFGHAAKHKSFIQREAAPRTYMILQELPPMSPLPPVYPRLYILAPAVGAEQHQSRGLEHWQTLAAPQVPRTALARQAEEHHRVEEDKEHKSRKLPSQAQKHRASRQEQRLEEPLYK